MGWNRPAWLVLIAWCTAGMLWMQPAAAWPGFDWDTWRDITRVTASEIESPQAGAAGLAPLPADESDWRDRDRAIRHALSKLMGEPTNIERETNPAVIGNAVKEDGYTRTHLLIPGEVADPIPAYLLEPDKPIALPAPVMIVLHQTQAGGKDEPCGLSGDPEMAFAVELVRRGFVCIVPDVIGFGERIPVGGQPYDGAHEFYRRHPKWSFFGKMNWDIGRVIDHLKTMPGIDAQRIGVIGHSHGAYGALMAAAFEPRIALAVASCGFTTLRSDPNPERWSHLTALLPRLGFYLDDIAQAPFDWHEVLALIAPRPLFNWATLEDTIFPNTDNLNLVYQQVQRVYTLHGAPDAFEGRLEPGSHAFPPANRHEAYDWLGGRFALAATREETPSPVWRATLRVDFGVDRGQNLGSLFEVMGPDGQAIAGAGFLGAYNTYFQADRHMLHAFVRPLGEFEPVRRTAVSYPSGKVHHYMFDIGDAVYATDRASPPSTHRWLPGQSRWETTPEPVTPTIPLGSQRLTLDANRILLDGQAVMEFDPAQGRIGLAYFAEHTLFFHMAVADSPEHQTRLYACPWDPATEDAIGLAQAVILPLTVPREFPYSYGQLDGGVIVGTNNGGVHRFRQGGWETLREADPTTSFQLYAMLTYHDRLLMGHYPTGELYEIVGDEVVRLEGWPPRPEGATPSAREVQSLTIYRGELFAGIWPWGEVWRLPAPGEPWAYHGRLFTHPPMIPSVTAPYEAEMSALGEPVNNLWGQRVTSLIPLGDQLLASTSNKGGAPMEPRLDFLVPDDRWREYGAVHHLQLPGHLSVPIQWAGAETEFVVEITGDALTVSQDGRALGSTPLDRESMEGFRADSIRWGEGVFGQLSGEITASTVETR